MPKHNDYEIFEHEHDFRKKHLNFKVTGGKEAEGVSEYLDNAEDTFIKIYEQVKGSKKTSINLVVLYKIINADGEEFYETLHIRSKVAIKDDGTNLQSLFKYTKMSLLTDLFFINNRGSGFTFLKVEEAHIDFDNFTQMKGGCHTTLPHFIASKKAIITPQNSDNQCFKYAIAICAFRNSHLKGTTHLNRIPNSLKRLAEAKFDWKGVKFPADKKSIDQFESNNPEYGVNVIYYDDGFKIYRTGYTEGKTELNLFWHDNHFFLITDLSKLLSTSINNHKGKVHFCPNCLCGFNSLLSLKCHKKMCYEQESATIVMPENNLLKVRNYQRQLRVPMFIAYDMEAMQRYLTKGDYEFGQRVDRNNEIIKKSYQKSLTKKHEPTGYFTKIKSDYPELLEELDNVTVEGYTGPDAKTKAAIWFLNKHVDVFEKCDFNKKKVMTDKDWIKHNSSDKCGLCGEKFMDSELNKAIKDMKFNEGKVIEELRKYKNLPDFHSYKVDFFDSEESDIIQEALDSGATYKEIMKEIDDQYAKVAVKMMQSQIVAECDGDDYFNREHNYPSDVFEHMKKCYNNIKPRFYKEQLSREFKGAKTEN